MNLHLQILKPLLKTEYYNKYSNYINTEFLDKNYPDIGRLYKCLPILHKEEKDYSIDDLKVALFTAYPKADEQQYNHLFEELKDTEVDSTLLVEYLRSAAERDKALQIARLAIQASEGVISFEEVKDRLTSMEETPSGVEDWRENIVTTDLRQLYGEQAHSGGLRWRLGSLNRALGPLRKGNFGFVFARPETGKTAFLSSELTFMAENLDENDGPIVWFNNEQAGIEVQRYIVRAALGLPDKGVEEDIDKYNEPFNQKVHGKLLLIDNIWYKKDMEKIVRELKPSLIVIDQIDNVKGFKADRPDLEFKEIYQWARELSQDLRTCHWYLSGRGIRRG